MGNENLEVDSSRSLSGESTADRVTCPVCQRPNRALTMAGRITRHHDLDKTARIRNGTGCVTNRVLCPGSGKTPEEARRAADA